MTVVAVVKQYGPTDQEEEDEEAEEAEDLLRGQDGRDEPTRDYCTSLATTTSTHGSTTSDLCTPTANDRPHRGTPAGTARITPWGMPEDHEGGSARKTQRTAQAHDALPAGPGPTAPLVPSHSVACPKHQAHDESQAEGSARQDTAQDATKERLRGRPDYTCPDTSIGLARDDGRTGTAAARAGAGPRRMQGWPRGMLPTLVHDDLVPTHLLERLLSHSQSEPRTPPPAPREPTSRIRRTGTDFRGSKSQQGGP